MTRARPFAAALALAVATACAAPGASGTQGAPPAAVDASAPPVSGQIVALPQTPTPLFGAAVQGAPAAVSNTGGAASAPLPPAQPVQPLPPDTSNAVSAPPVPTLAPPAAAAATANAATAIAGATRVAATATALPSQEIRLQNFAITPQTITVQPGTTVVWRNLDAAAHQISGSDFDSGRILSGEYWAAQFQRPGKFDYVCVIHPTMRGQIVVSDAKTAIQMGS